MSYISLQEKYDHLKLLIHLAKADGKVVLSELTYLVWVAKELEVSDQELQRLVESEDLPQVFFSFTEEKIKQFHRLLLILKVDGVAESKELDEVIKIGKLMGFEEGKLVLLVEQIRHEPSKVLSVDTIQFALS